MHKKIKAKRQKVKERREGEVKFLDIHSDILNLNKPQHLKRLIENV